MIQTSEAWSWDKIIIINEHKCIKKTSDVPAVQYKVSRSGKISSSSFLNCVTMPVNKSVCMKSVCFSKMVLVWLGQRPEHHRSHAHMHKTFCACVYESWVAAGTCLFRCLKSVMVFYLQHLGLDFWQEFGWNTWLRASVFSLHIDVSLISLQPLSMLILLSIMTVIIIVTVHLIVVFTALQQINNICAGLFQSILTLLLNSCVVSEDHTIFTFFGYH